MEQLSTRALNRALLARQFLLERTSKPILSVIQHLCGLQAQQSRPPYTGLWSRLTDLKPDDLRALVQQRRVIRATSFRGTLHLLTPADYQSWRPVLQPMLTAGCQSILKERLATFDHAEVILHAKACFSRGPRSFNTLRDELSAAFPEADPRALGYFVRLHLPLASLPEDDTCFELIPLVSSLSPADSCMEPLIARYLGAFGPASVADFQTWSGVKGSKVSFEKMDLLTFTDSRKRVLYDFPDAPRPDPDVPAPVRLIAEFDNIVLGHADRSRIVADAYRPRLVTRNLQIPGTFLVDGFVAGTWKRLGKNVQFDPFEPLRPKTRKALEAEAAALNT